MSLETKPSDYLASPERAIALLNRVMSSGGGLAAIEQALCIVARALERAGIQGPECLPAFRTNTAPPDRLTASKPAAARVEISQALGR